MSQETELIGKRVFVWVLSIAIGISGAFATVAAFGTTVERYAVKLNFGWLDLIVNNFFFLGLAYAALAWIWLDYILKTQILRD